MINFLLHWMKIAPLIGIQLSPGWSYKSNTWLRLYKFILNPTTKILCGSFCDYCRNTLLLFRLYHPENNLLCHSYLKQCSRQCWSYWWHLGLAAASCCRHICSWLNRADVFVTCERGRAHDDRNVWRCIQSIYATNKDAYSVNYLTDNVLCQ